MDRIGDWAGKHGAAMIGIGVAALVLVWVLRRAIPSGVQRAVLRDTTPLTEAEQRKRADTLSAVLLGSAEVVVLVITLLLMVQELGVNVAPVIAGLGIGGIAVGLGAQSLVKDAINGILILLENQYGRGDMVRVGGVQGWVEEVNLRRTVLRDTDGTVHNIPNSEIKVASNLTRGFSGVNLTITVASGQDVDRAIALLDQAGAEVATDAALSAKVVDAPRVTSVDSVSAATVALRVVGRVAPGAQWEVTSALRRRVIRLYEAEGIRFGPMEPAPAPPPAPAPAAR